MHQLDDNFALKPESNIRARSLRRRRAFGAPANPRPLPQPVLCCLPRARARIFRGRASLLCIASTVATFPIRSSSAQVLGPGASARTAVGRTPHTHALRERPALRDIDRPAMESEAWSTIRRAGKWQASGTRLQLYEGATGPGAALLWSCRRRGCFAMGHCVRAPPPRRRSIGRPRAGTPRTARSPSRAPPRGSATRRRPWGARCTPRAPSVVGAAMAS